MRLVPTSGPLDAILLEEDEDNVVLGRQPRRGRRVDDGTVSREHARLFRRDGAWHVADLNSSNGTWVNGQKVSRAALAAGDLLRLGQVEFRVELATGGPARPAPAGSMPSMDELFPEDGVAAEERSEPDDGGIQLEDPLGSAAPDSTMIVPPRPLFTPSPTQGAPRPKALSNVALQRTPKAAGSILAQDVGQFGFLRRLLILAVVLALCAGAFFAVMKLTESVVPEGGAPPATTPAEDDAGE